MAAYPLCEAELEEIRKHLEDTRSEHRDLDQVITHLIECPPKDDLLIVRLKKRKLALKDKMLLLEQLLVPDIPA